MSVENSEGKLKKSLIFSVHCFPFVKADASWSSVSIHSGM